MHLPRPDPVRACLAAVLGMLPVLASALGLGAGPGAVLLGQPLDISIPVRLDADESLGLECVQAEVSIGERSVPAGVRVRANAAGGTSLRVTTAVIVDEPVVAVNVTAGCTSRVVRRYVMLADPASSPAPSPVPPAAQMAPSALPPSEVVTATPAAAASTAPAPAPTPTPTPASSGTAADAPAGPARASTTAAATTPSRRAEPTRRSERAARPAAATAQRRAAAAERRARAAAARQAAVGAPRAEARARLTLEPAEAEVISAPTSPNAVIDEALAAVAQAASQARAAAAAASASQARIAELERGVERARAEAQSRQAEAEALRARLREAQAPWWSWLLFGLSTLLALVAAWMAWRMRGMQQAQEVAWARATALPAAHPPAATQAPTSVMPTAEAPLRETAPLPLITSEMTQPAALSFGVEPTVAMAPRAAPKAHEPGRSVDDEEDSAMARTMVLPPNVRVDLPAPPRIDLHDSPTPRDVSIEELIDVDQQAEFFLAIGQDQAAIELLVAHLRNTGGGSPLTYLKLLDIYRRLGEKEDYERTRSRFNHRFNAHAPEWGADLHAGRSLEDYEGVLPRLQAAWPRPLDAMAELEALLFRKSRGELFELPAYRDVLFLYALARDLLERDNLLSGGDVGNVDLLLPLNLDAAGTAPPRVGDSRATTDMPLDDHPTAPLDLDLTPLATPQSIFTELPTLPLARGRRADS